LRADKIKKLKPGQPNPLNDKEKAYILKHYETKTVPWMATKLHRWTVKIYEYLDEQGLDSFNPNLQGRKRKMASGVPGGYFKEHARENWLI
jgi:hypothetical protein